MGKFHAKSGLYFERVGDTVEVSGGDAMTIVLDAGTWASVVASMSAAGESAETFYAALRDFEGGVPSG